MATAVDISINGTAQKGIAGYTVSEESTPIDPADTTGAAGTFSATFWRNRLNFIDFKRMYRKIVEIIDKGQGTTQGIARTPSSSGNTITLGADSRATLLNVVRQAAPFNGTLGNYLAYVLGLVDITSGYVVDSSLSSIAVTMQGWDNEVWLQLKKLAVVYRFEVSLVSDNIVFRPVRGRITVDKRDATYDWAMDDTQLALSVVGFYYKNTRRVNYLAYPDGGWNSNVQVYQVDAGEDLDFELPLNASIESVQQPVALDFVGQYDNSQSAYCVMGQDGLPITAAQWNANGGSVTVSISDDTKTLVVHVVGMKDTTGQLAPYRLAATAGPSNNYSSLRILATGTFFSKTQWTQPTTISTDLATTDEAPQIDNEFISTLDQLLDAMIWSLKRHGGARQTMSVKTAGINRKGESGSYVYPTIADFNAEMAAASISTIAQFNAAKTGLTLQQFNDAELARVATSFVNQAFGNIAGARSLRDYLWWRIRSATIGPDGVSYTAEDDTTLGDFDTTWTGFTVADFNASWQGHTIADFNVVPLLQDLEGHVYPSAGLYPSSQTYTA